MAVGIATIIQQQQKQFAFIVFYLLPVAFEANGNRHSPGGSRLSNNGQAQIH
jgi:hypothetical protein